MSVSPVLRFRNPTLRTPIRGVWSTTLAFKTTAYLYSQKCSVCCSTHKQIQNRNNEEVCQILSIINFKIIQYSMLIQNTKGFPQTFRKITGCIHAMSAILSDNNVPFSAFFLNSSLHCFLSGKRCNINS